MYPSCQAVGVKTPATRYQPRCINASALPSLARAKLAFNMQAITATAEPGTIERALQLLRLLATAGKRGLGLTELAQKTGLPHSTVHRLLRRLIKERMVAQRTSSRRYTLGRMAFELGLAAAGMFDLRATCRETLERLAEEVGDTVYLTVRSGAESVCEGRYEGPSPIRVFTLDIGSRRPLGLGAGGLAILAFLPELEREDMITTVASQIESQGQLSEQDFRESIYSCRQQGYAFIRNRVTLGVAAVGVPIFDSLDMPVAAISVAAIVERMSESRAASLARMLQMKARAIKQALMTQAVID